MHQARRIGPKFLLKACMVVLCMAATCDGCGDPTEESADDCVDFDPAQGCMDADAKAIHLTLLNISSQQVHLFLVDKNENFPCCQVQGSSSREIPAYRVRDGAQLTVAAGRNGVILETITCQVGPVEFLSKAKVFDWNNGWSC